MKADFGRIHWGRVLLAGALAAGLSVALAFLVVAVYATSLAFQARTQPDQTQIAAFAAQVSRWLRPILAVLFAFGGAFWVVRKVGDPAQLQGGLVGVVVALALLAATMICGKVRRTVLAVLRFDRQTKAIYAVSAWKGSDWYSNIQASPALQIQSGFVRYNPVQRTLSPKEITTTFLG